MAIFEIVPTILNEESVEKNLTEWDFVEIRLQYKLPSSNILKEFKVNGSLNFTPFDDVDKYLRFSSAVVMFGSLLRTSQFVKNTNWNDVLVIALESYDIKDPLQKNLFLWLNRLK